MKDLMKLARECMKDLDSLGIRYGQVHKWEINTRAKKRWGQCRKVAEGVFEISISRMLLDDAITDQAVKDTILHELLHTVPGCIQHQGRWNELSDYVNRRLPAYNIQRTTSCAEKGIAETDTAQTARYILQCSKCRVRIYRQRTSALVENPGRYRCAACGGSIVRVK